MLGQDYTCLNQAYTGLHQEGCQQCQEDLDCIHGDIQMLVLDNAGLNQVYAYIYQEYCVQISAGSDYIH